MMRRSMRRGDESGTTLVELLVTMVVMSMLMVMVVGLVVAVNRNFTRDRSATDNASIASIGMNEVTRVIRSGTEIRVANQALNDPVFLAATPESVVLRAYLDTSAATPAPIVVRLEVTAQRTLVEKRWNAVAGTAPYWKFTNLPAAPYQPASSFWIKPAYTRTIASKITPMTASLKLFRFYTKDNVEVVPPTTGSLTVDQLRTVASVTVSLSVQSDLTARANPVVITNIVGIPNLGISRIGA